MTTKTRRKIKKVHGIAVETFSVEALMKNEGLAAYVWPHEGEWSKGGFLFHDNYSDFEPLLVDANTRWLLKQVYEKLDEPNQANMKEEMEKHRGFFGKIVDACWRISKG